jgi:hypothetical protein
MNRRLFFILTLFLSSFINSNAQTPFPDAGKVFQDDIIPKVYIEIDPGDLQTILDPDNAFSEEHFPATFIFDTGNDRDTVDNIGFRLRGNTSQLSQKKSFKISFNTFEPGRKYKGLEKMNINGEHNDPSVIRAKLYWDLCRQFGIVASRCNHVELYINGEYRGLHLNVEHVDEEFVQLRYGGQIGNLYKCLYPADLDYISSSPDSYKFESNGRRAYDLKTNIAEDDYGDLAQFIHILNNTSDSQLPCELEQVFNVQNYLKVIALDILTAHWDGPIFNKNNFYLYNNPYTEKMEFIPYDPDNTFGIRWFGEWTDRDLYDWSPGGEPRPIYTRLMENEMYRNQFTYYMAKLLDLYYNQMDFFDDIDAKREQIKGSIPDDPYYPLDYGFTYNDFIDSYTQGIPDAFHVPHGLKEFISIRYTSAFDQLESTDAAPIITNVRVQSGNALQDILVLATIEDEDVVDASIEYSFGGESGSIILYDDGLHNDGSANDQVYGGIIPAFEEDGILTYFISATDGSTNNNRYPFCTTYSLQINNNTVQLYINEFMASNDATVSDEQGDFDDWIELYNGSSESIDLSDYFLSDNANNPTKWALPEINLQAGAFILIWADDGIEEGPLHANFKLSASGEEIILANNFGSAIDQIVFGPQDNDEATGRIPNGTGVMQPVTPTPGASNVPVSINEVPLPEYSLLPNPFNYSLIVTSAESITQLRLLDITGKVLLAQKNPGNSVELNIKTLADGMYFLQLNFANGSGTSVSVVKSE